MAFQYAGRYIEALLKNSSGTAKLLSGIPVIIRETDGTTLATVYEGRSKTATVANPVITSADGNVDAWLDPGNYLGYPVIAGVEQAAFPIRVEIDPAEADAPSAADVTVTPVGGIVATDAQAALEGLDASLTAEGAARVAGDALAVPLTQRGAANGVATLGADSKVPAAQIPAIALSEYLGTVASEAAMLALAGQTGDWAIRSDTGTTWVLIGADPTSLADWKQLATPTDVVTSVNGRIGAVVGLAEAADLTAEAAARAAADALLVPKSLYDANSVIVAVNDDTPVAQQLAFFRVLGRMGGNIAALTGGDLKTLIGAGTASGVSTLDGSSRVVEAPKLHHAEHEVGGADAFTGPLAAPTLEVSGKNGLAARRFSGRKITAGAPTTGTWAVDDEVLDSAGVLWRCTVAGTPGTWVQVTTAGTSATALTQAANADVVPIFKVQPADTNRGPSGGDFFAALFVATWDPVLRLGNNFDGSKAGDPINRYMWEGRYWDGSNFLVEQYSEVYSPDHSSWFFRPWAYTACVDDNVAANSKWARVYMDIGISTDGNKSQFVVTGVAPIATFNNQQIVFAKPLTMTASLLTTNSTSAGNTGIQFSIDGTAKWQNILYRGDTNLYVWDLVGGRFQVKYTTGASSSAATTEFQSKVQVDGALILANGTGAGGTAATGRVYGGSGAPVDASGANGDIYFRTDGGSLTTIYQRRAGAWVGIV